VVPLKTWQVIGTESVWPFRSRILSTPRNYAFGKGATSLLGGKGIEMSRGRLGLRENRAAPAQNQQWRQEEKSTAPK
jgi:hypothetical protein